MINITLNLYTVDDATTYTVRLFEAHKNNNVAVKVIQ